MSTGRVKVNVPGQYNDIVPVVGSESVESVLEKVGCASDSNKLKQILVNGKPASLDTMLQDGDTLYVLPQVAGNR